MATTSSAHDHPRTLRAIALLAGALLLATAAAGPAAAGTAAPEVPVLGQAVGGPSTTVDGAREGLVSLHGVRRTEESTVVYWSVGWTPDTESGDRVDLANTFGHPISRLGLERPHGSPTADVAVIDTEGKQAFTPVIDDDGDCFCSDIVSALPSEYGAEVEPAPGRAYVMYAILPALPEGLEATTVKVAGKVFLDVPVADGKMTPAADSDGPILIGTGWPALDPASIHEVSDLGRFVYPLSHNSAVRDSAVSSREEEDQTSIDISADVLFDVDEDTLTGEAEEEIRVAAQEIEAAGATGTITLTGHTDSDGGEQHNQDLSERRARAVTEELTPQLPDGTTVASAGRGESEPLASNETEAGKEKNRRVTITIAGDAS